jgi:transglutaminase 1
MEEVISDVIEPVVEAQPIIPFEPIVPVMPTSSTGRRGVGWSDASLPGRRLRSLGLGLDDLVDGGSSAMNGRHYVPTTSDANLLDNFLRTDIHLEKPEANHLRVQHISRRRWRNKNDHNTIFYDQLNLIVRRGQSFEMGLLFNREFDPSTDVVLLQFTFGRRPQISRGTLIRVPFVETLDPERWCARIKRRDGFSMEIEVMPAADAYVGKYSMFVETVVTVGQTKATFRMKHDLPMYCLFNPWSQHDQVFLGDEAGRDEYVMNERGRIWTGKPGSSRSWNFGQFEEECLDGTLHLLEASEIADTARGNAILVARCLTAMANSSDDYGVLTGRWSKDWPENCTKPWEWIGSVKIMEEYVRTKRPVKYGQCWVFSGLLTTLCRTLGIPCRPVTNFSSAHDSDGSMTIDFHFDEADDPMDYLDDSIWNFHVWNECWMSRPDLPQGYGGWQAIDSTPQEASEGVMRCGPASVRAIREGHVYLPYDTPFIYGEVNGDVCNWKVNTHDLSYEVSNINSHTVGRYISTKKVGSSFIREDLTLQYKFPEFSSDETRVRDQVMKMSHRYRHVKASRDTSKDDVIFQLKMPDQMPYGTDGVAELVMTNKSIQPRSVTVSLHAKISFYTGVPTETLTTSKAKLVVGPQQTTVHTLSLRASEYLSKIIDDGKIKIYAHTMVAETQQHWAATDFAEMDKPDLIMKSLSPSIAVGQPFVIEIGFRNPLKEDLTGCKLTLEGAGIERTKTIQIRDVKAGESMSEVVALRPRRAGLREVVATFSSKQIVGINGSVDISVKDAAS